MDNSSYTQKPVRERNSLAWEIALIVAVGLLLSYGIANASFLYNEDFESYDVGDICNQDDWICYSSPDTGTTSIQVDYSHSPTKAVITCPVFWTGNFHNIRKTFTQLSSGSFTFWVMPHSKAMDKERGTNVSMYLGQDAGNDTWVSASSLGFWCDNDDCDLENYIMSTSTTRTDPGVPGCAFTSLEWTFVEVQFNSDTNSAIVRCNDTGSWYNLSVSDDFSYWDKIQMVDMNCTAWSHTPWYFDDFGTMPGPEYPDETTFHTLVLSAYPNLSQVGTIFTTTIENESYFSVLNSYYVKLYNGDPEGFSYLENQYLSIATTTYHLYEHTGTTTIHIATATTTQSGGIYPTDSSSDCWDNPWNDDHSCIYWQSVPEDTPTYFDTDLMTPGKTYFLKFEITFDPLDYISDTTITISDSSWTEHWILYGEYDILTETYEFASPDDYDIMIGTDPFDYDEGLSTTTGDIIADIGSWLKEVTTYLSFLIYREGTFTFNLIELFTNPRGSLEKIISKFDVREKIPFSYMTEIKDLVADELENIGDYTATTTEGIINIPYIGSVKIFNIYQVKITYATPLANLRTIIEYTLWIGFIFYIWKKIKSFGR